MRQQKDKRAAAIITLGGLFVLLTLTALLWHLIASVTPLLREPELELTHQYELPAGASLEAFGTQGGGQIWFLRERDSCGLSLYDPVEKVTLQRLSDHCRTRVLSSNHQFYLAEISDLGELSVERLALLGDRLERSPVFSLDVPETALPSGVEFSLAQSSQEWVFVASHERQHQLYRIDKGNTSRVQVLTIAGGAVVALPESGQIVSTDKGQLVFHTLSGERLSSVVTRSQPLALFASPSQRGFYMTSVDGQVEKWNLINRGGGLTFEPSYRVPIGKGIAAIVTMPEYNAAVALMGLNQLVVFNSTHGEVAQRSTLPSSVSSVLFEQDSVLALYPQRAEWRHWRHMSSVTDQVSLWHEVTYEGYPDADYVWQSTPGADGVEVKFSLVPLVVGSFKAAVYAMVVALPLALCLALYSGFLVANPIRNVLKPSIELIEAIPSVLLGFVAAIWLIPLAEQTLMAILFVVVMLVPCSVVIAVLCRWAASRFANRWRQGSEILFALTLVFLLAVAFGEVKPALLLWWQGASYLHLPVTAVSGQGGKNTLVVALALGFAIIPTLYSIAEDAVYEVPKELRNASLALGATQLQTLRNVVLIAAMPGIFAAVVLGFGRALGETMILLMVTGNTPVTDWNLFNGLRSVAANLAIELPEAEVDSLHYQVLMLSALLLFVFTFAFNTLAELIRGKLRRRIDYE